MTPLEYLKNILLMIRGQLHNQLDLHREYERLRQEVLEKTPGTPAAHGYKIYSQCDEDGIIENIFLQLGEGGKVFVEIGCSDGLENNTHTLLLRGWRGVWIDADTKKINRITGALPISDRLVVQCSYVTKVNAWDIVRTAVSRIKANAVDFLSIDIDGDDVQVLLALLAHIQPRVLCVEYNAKFPPPLAISVRAGTGTWKGDDYQGGSLSTFTDVLQRFGYRLIACSLSGVNAFFVKNSDASKFPDLTPAELYQPPRYYLGQLKSGHRPSLKYLADALTQ